MSTLARHAALAAILAFGLPAAASPLQVEAEDAADHHVSAQGHYPGGLGHSWEWNLGSRQSARNITGIAAMGLVAIHRMTGLSEHEDAALRAARSLIKAYDRGWKAHRPYTQDIEFLVQAGFIIDAARWFQITTGRYPAPTYADLVIQGRKKARIPQVAGWDLASAARAALAVGQTRYARALVDELLRRRGEWDRPGVGQDLARGSLLWTLGELRVRGALTPAQRAVALSLARELAAGQAASGAWPEKHGATTLCTQTTAYAILGLSRWREGAAAAARGRSWLTQAALTDRRFFNGGRIWATTYVEGQPENNFNSEIQSEAMMALATASTR